MFRGLQVPRLFERLRRLDEGDDQETVPLGQDLVVEMGLLALVPREQQRLVHPAQHGVEVVDGHVHAFGRAVGASGEIEDV